MRCSLGLWFCLLLLLGTSSVWAAEQPNIVLIMSDDMGFSDIGCYGGEIETPHLDSLANSGLRFSQFYNTGRCCPTRASLLTGLYPHQAGIGHMVDRWSKRSSPGYDGDLNRNCRTFAEVLKPAGYRTYLAGKWHVAADVGPEGPQHNWPLQRGFDRFYGTIIGAGSFFDPATLTRDNTSISPFADPEYQPEEYYYTHAISDHAVRFVQDHHFQHGDQPFLLYVAYTAAHWPMHALAADIAKYQGRYAQGYAAIQAARLKKLRTLGMLDDRWEEAAMTGDWSSVEHREWEARCMEVYAAMVDSMDQGIGRILNALDQTGARENTLILFLQDNGGCAEGVGRKGKRRRPQPPTEAPIAADTLVQSVIPKQNRAGVPTLTGPYIMPGPEDTYIAYGKHWATLSNTPFREYKHWVHEGGVATPLIVHWPRGIDRQRHGQIVHDPSHLIDLMATFVDVSAAKYPTQVGGMTIHPLEGISLRPALTGQPLQRTVPIFFEHEGNRAVRDGPWKLVAKGAAGAWELYDMRSDRTEQHNLASREPDRVASMVTAWEEWAHRANVLPWIWKTPYGQ